MIYLNQTFKKNLDLFFDIQGITQKNPDLKTCKELSLFLDIQNITLNYPEIKTCEQLSEVLVMNLQLEIDE